MNGGHSWLLSVQPRVVVEGVVQVVRCGWLVVGHKAQGARLMRHGSNATNNRSTTWLRN